MSSLTEIEERLLKYALAVLVPIVFAVCGAWLCRFAVDRGSLSAMTLGGFLIIAAVILGFAVVMRLLRR